MGRVRGQTQLIPYFYWGLRRDNVRDRRSLAEIESVLMLERRCNDKARKTRVPASRRETPNAR